MLSDSHEPFQRQNNLNSFESVGVSLNNLLYRWFDRLILLVILVNSIFLALDSPSDNTKNYQFYADYVFLVIYTIEMCLKVIAMGFLLRPHSYLRDLWNVVILYSSLSRFSLTSLWWSWGGWVRYSLRRTCLQSEWWEFWDLLELSTQCQEWESWSSLSLPLCPPCLTSSFSLFSYTSCWEQLVSSSLWVNSNTDVTTELDCTSTMTMATRPSVSRMTSQECRCVSLASPA